MDILKQVFCVSSAIVIVSIALGFIVAFGKDLKKLKSEPLLSRIFVYVIYVGFVGMVLSGGMAFVIFLLGACF